jgi:uncharacterized protein YdcH (DUF465 family)
MLGEHHNLAREFPEYKDQIHELKVNDPEFAQLFEKYEDIDKEIYRIEMQIENTSDEYLEGLKIKRVKLKDQLYAMLQQA